MYTTIFSIMTVLFPFIFIYDLRKEPEFPCKSSRFWYLIRLIVLLIIIKRFQSDPAFAALFLIFSFIIDVSWAYYEDRTGVDIGGFPWGYIIWETLVFVILEYFRSKLPILAASSLTSFSCCVLAGIITAGFETLLYPSRHLVDQFLEKSSDHFSLEEFAKFWNSIKDSTRGISFHTILTSIISILAYLIIKSLVG